LRKMRSESEPEVNVRAKGRVDRSTILSADKK
jgi:hypothetical protein